LGVDLSLLDPIVFAEVTGPAAGTALIFLIVRVGDPSTKSAVAQHPARPDVIVDDYFVARNDFRDQGEIDFAHLTLSSRKRRIAPDLYFTPHMIEIALTLCIPAPELRQLSQLIKRIDFDSCARFCERIDTYSLHSEADIARSHALARDWRSTASLRAVWSTTVIK
jgi:hypothetical protein